MWGDRRSAAQRTRVEPDTLGRDPGPPSPLDGHEGVRQVTGDAADLHPEPLVLRVAGHEEVVVLDPVVPQDDRLPAALLH